MFAGVVCECVHVQAVNRYRSNQDVSHAGVAVSGSVPGDGQTLVEHLVSDVHQTPAAVRVSQADCLRDDNLYCHFCLAVW